MKLIKYLSILLVVASLWSCSGNNGKSDAYGNFEADEVLISSESNGKVIQLNVSEGDKVEKGAEICVIDTMALHLQRNQLLASRKAALVGLDKVRSAIDVQKTQKSVIEKDVARITKMIAEGAATQKQYDDATGQLDVVNQQIINTQTQLASVNAEVGVIDSKIASMNDQIARCYIKVPQSGVILLKLAEEGEMVAIGKPVFKLAPLDELYLRAYVSGDMLDDIAIGQQVKVFFDLDEDSNQSTVGIISWISSTSEFTPKIIQTKKERVDQVYAFKVKVKNDGKLKIGMPGEVVIKE
ncbi:MAG: HlyD family efflux transporter periplasmic adaptor subunit [Marinilabiliaceae bacterium]|nr:HlyD family efflux transporter periplasmic adaptor subunit [Marinilabiliaceae bacterium]